MPSITSLHIANPDSGRFEPYRHYDWVLWINGLSDSEGLCLSVETAFMPEVGFEEIPMGFGNDYVNVPGKATVEPGTAVFRDFVDPHTEGILTAWWLKHYDPYTGIQFPATNYMTSGWIQKLAPGTPGNGGGPRWDLYGMWMQRFATGSTMDMTSSDVKKLEVTFRFQRAYPAYARGASASGAFAGAAAGGRISGPVTSGGGAFGGAAAGVGG